MDELLELKKWHESQQGRAGTLGETRSAAANPAGSELPADSPPRSHGEYLPTPETIRRRCLEIQAEWSNSEHRRRAAGTSQRRSPGIRVHRLWSPTPDCA